MIWLQRLARNLKIQQSSHGKPAQWYLPEQGGPEALTSAPYFQELSQTKHTPKQTRSLQVWLEVCTTVLKTVAEQALSKTVLKTRSPCREKALPCRKKGPPPRSLKAEQKLWHGHCNKGSRCVTNCRQGDTVHEQSDYQNQANSLSSSCSTITAPASPIPHRRTDFWSDRGLPHLCRG